MNILKVFGGVAAGAIASVAVGFVAATIGLATFALVPAIVFGAVIGMLLSIHNAFQPQGTAENAVFGAVMTCAGYALVSGFAALSIAGFAVAAFTGVLVGWLYTFVSETLG